MMNINSESSQKANSNKIILDKINDLIKSDNINNIDMINEIIKLIINNMDITSINNSNNLDNISTQNFSKSDMTDRQNTSKLFYSMNNQNDLRVDMNRIELEIQNEAQQKAEQKLDQNIETNNEKELEQKTKQNANTNTNTNQAQTGTGSSSTSTATDELQSIVNTLTQINNLKEQLCLLPLNFCQKDYFINEIFPMLDLMNRLAGTASNISFSTGVLQSTPIVPCDKSKIKEFIYAMYSMNDLTCRLYKIIKKKIEQLTKC